MPKRDDRLLLMDISEAGEKILRFTTGYNFETYLGDEKTIDAVIRNFQVIGEASRHLSQHIIHQQPQIEWHKMIGFRNLLVHEYFGINHQLVWETIQNYVPKTMEMIGILLDGMTPDAKVP